MEARTREKETLDLIKARSEEKGSFLLSASIEATRLKKAEVLGIREVSLHVVLHYTVKFHVGVANFGVETPVHDVS